ncbi:E3 SUMO-protein ligase PIAS1-like isoform X2 [Tigriopus californicus]|nr:E3 SUMO-protein ligase PIAS1-like isoform X2 [Tigriopus californicus]
MNPNYAGMGHFPNMSAAAAIMEYYGNSNARNPPVGPSPPALGLPGRNPYAGGSGSGYAAAAAVAAAAAAANVGVGGNIYGANPYQPIHQSRAATIPVHPDVKFVRLPFFDIDAELLRPASLLCPGSNRFQEAQFQFFLTPSQATNIASNRDISLGSQVDYLYQIQLRFSQLSLEAGKEVSDEFPPSIHVLVNNKTAPLPNPIPTNKPGVEPKRPPRPVNITSLCKLSPILPNTINVKWAAEYGKGWVVGVWLVMKLSSKDLLDRLQSKGIRKKEYTRKLIKEKLSDDDCEVATTSLKVSLTCPLGKMRMQTPCRPSTCSHLQCFDAMLFLQMNERKPTWNCPVCDSKALYDTLMIDGYFLEVLESAELPKDENEIILERDGSWKPVPKEEDKPNSGSSSQPKESSAPTANDGASSSGQPNKDEEVECIQLSDDEDFTPSSGGPHPPSSDPPLPPPPPLPPMPPMPPTQQEAPPPPPPPKEIECIDLD